MRAGPIVALLLLLAAPARAQEDDLNRILEGFDQDPEAAAGPREKVHETRFWELDGSFSAQGSYAYAHDSPPAGQPDYRGPAVLRTQLALELDLDLPRSWRARIAGRGFYDWAYALEGRGDFADRTLDLHQQELELQEVWIEGSLLENLDLKFGRQIVNWGRSETLRVVDVLNPLDNREPGLVDIEDLRLPVTMTRLDYYLGPWQLTGIAVHETRSNDDPEPGSEFYPFQTVSSGSLPISFDLADYEDERPHSGGRNTEWAAALTGVFSGWDVSFHWARFFDDTPYFEIRSLPSLDLLSLLPPELLALPPDQLLAVLPPGALTQPALVGRHARETLLGASTNVALGNWLLKAEAAYLRGVRYLSIPGVAGQRKSRYDVMVGVEYSGFTDTNLALELAQRHVAGYDPLFGLPPVLAPLADEISGFTQRNQLETAFRYSGDFLHQRLHLTLLTLLVGPKADDGGLVRVSGDYELAEALTVGGGAVLFLGGDLLTYDGIKDNDRLYLSLKYSF